MRLRQNASQQHIGENEAIQRVGNGTPVRHVDGVTGRRIVQVGDAQTIVVRPRISGWYKALLGLSLALNLLVLLVLLIAGVSAYRFYRAFGGEVRALVADSPAEEQLAALRSDPSAAAAFTVDTARQGVEETLGAVQELENSTIRARIPIDHQLPLQLSVPIDQTTTVVTTGAVPLSAPAQFNLPGNAGVLNGVVSLSLPPGLQLPVHLGLTVPLSSTIPVKFDVPVDIPVRDTELQAPFARLRRLLEPVAAFLGKDER